MMKPTIHWNGTSADQLLSELVNASDALFQAVAALSSAAPNARDYYPQGAAAFEQARREHEAKS